MANRAHIKGTKPGAMEVKGNREKETKEIVEPRKRRTYCHAGGGQIC